jgi:hypothetical protein
MKGRTRGYWNQEEGNMEEDRKKGHESESEAKEGSYDGYND